MPSRTVPRRRWPGLLAALISIALIGVSAAPAHAAVAWPSHPSFTSTSYNGGRSNVRYCPNDDSCPILFQLGNGSTVYMLCWIDSDWAFGNAWSNRWFRIQDAANRQGFIHSTLVHNQAPSPNCSA